MKVVLADVEPAALDEATAALRGAGRLTARTDTPYDPRLGRCSQMGVRNCLSFSRPGWTIPGRGGKGPPGETKGKGVPVEVSEIIRIVIIVGLLLIALPFPIALVAAAAAWAIALYFAVEALLGDTKGRGMDQGGRPHPSGGVPPP
jgi:hypothetical protein